MLCDILRAVKKTLDTLTMIKLEHAHISRPGAVMGILGPTAVVDISVAVPDNFDLPAMDTMLDQVLGYTCGINTDDPALRILHRGIGLSSYLQGMNRIVVPNNYLVLGRDQLEDRVRFTVVISLVHAEATELSYGFVDQLMSLFLTKTTKQQVDDIIAKANGKLDRYGLPGQNQGFLVTLCMKRAMPVRQIWPGTHQVGTGRYSQRISSTMTPVTSAQGVLYAKNKVSTAHLLHQAGLPGPIHEVVTTWEETRAAARTFGWPVVVKPYDRDNGVGVSAGIETEADLRVAYDAVSQIVPSFLVERHFTGVGHRVTIVDGHVITVTKKLPPSVTGDGASTVRELVDALHTDNRFIKRPDGGEPFILIGSGIQPQTIDSEVRGMIAQQGFDVDSVLPAGHNLVLRRRNNASSGGITRAIDAATVHPDNQELCLRAARVVDLDIAGIDLIIPDITRSWLESGALICEVNAVPQVGYNHGITQIVDYFFRSGWRIPVHLAIFESRGDLDPGLAAELSHVTHSNGIGLKQGLWINGRQVGHAFESGFDAARAIIFDREVDSALCVMTRQEVIELGLPLDRFDQIFVEHLGDLEPLIAPHTDRIRPLEVHRG